MKVAWKKDVEWKRKMVETRRQNNSYHHSRGTRRKMSKAFTGVRKPKRTQVHKDNISKALTGRELSPTHIRSLKKAKQFISDDYRKKMSESHKGPKCATWAGGISSYPYPSSWTDSLKSSVRQRDNHLCRVCGRKQNGRNHAVHHIDYDKKNCNPNNLVTLCSSCHTKTISDRKKWEVFFKNGIKSRKNVSI